MFFNEIINYLTSEEDLSEDQLQLLNSLASIFVEFPIDNEPPSSQL